MAELKAIIDKLEDVDEALRGLYRETDDGKFVLDLSDDEIKLHPGTQPLQSAMKHAKDERKTARDRVKALEDEAQELLAIAERFKDIDPEKARAALKQAQEIADKKLLDAGQIDELVAERTERMKADLTAKIEAAATALEASTAQVTVLSTELSDIKIFNTIREAAIKAGARSEALEDIVQRARPVWKLVDGAAVAFKAGTSDGLFGKSGEPMGIDEWVTTLTEGAPHLFKGSAGGGAENQDDVDKGRASGDVKVVTREQSGDHLADIAEGKVRIEPAKE